MNTLKSQIPIHHQTPVLKGILETLKESILITTASVDDPRIVYANIRFLAMTGYHLEEVLGETPRILQGPRTNREEISRLKRELSATGYFKNGHAINYRKDRSEYVVEWDISPIFDDEGVLIYYVSIQRDVTDLFEAKRQIDMLNEQIQGYLHKAH